MTSLSGNADVLTIEPTVAGTYNYVYTVIDDFGCVHDTSVNIIVEPSPIVFAGNDTTLCGGNDLQLNGTLNGAGAVSDCLYDLQIEDTFGDGWNENTLTVVINGVSTNYTLTTGDLQNFPITIPSGATATFNFNAIGNWIGECLYTLFDEAGNPVFTQGPNLFGNATNTITANCAGDFVYAWTPTQGITDATILDPTFSLTTPTTLTLTVYPNGAPECAVSDDIYISLSANPDAGIDGAIDLCSQGAPIDLFTLLIGTPSPNGIWLDANGNQINMPFDPAVSPFGAYTYQVDSLGCLDESIVTVGEITTEISSIVVTDVNCNSAANGSALVNGVNIASYSLNGGAQVNAVVPFTLNNLAPGNYTLDVYSIDGCSDAQNFTVIEPSPLQITFITADTSVCPGSIVNLSAIGTGGNGVYIYTWTANGTPLGVGQNMTVTPVSGTTNYCVELSEACGSPVDNDCLTITTPPAINPELIPDTLNGCFPLAINFQNTTSSPDVATTIVNFGDGTIETYVGLASFSHVYEQAGIYTVTVDIISTLGCEYQTIYTNWIEAYSYPVAGFVINPNNVSMFNPYVTLINQSSSDAVVFDWQISGGNPLSSAAPSVNVQYPDGVPSNYPVTLTVYNAYGCEDSITLVVNILNEILLYVPNTFTPDNDEFNQNWGIHISGINIFNFDLFVFNRWGEIIWESHDPEATWDGTFNGEIVQDGTYSWTIRCAALTNDDKHTFNGHLNVIR